MSTITARRALEMADDGLLSHLNDEGLANAGKVIADDTDLDPADRDRAIKAIEEERAARAKAA